MFLRKFLHNFYKDKTSDMCLAKPFDYDE